LDDHKAFLPLPPPRSRPAASFRRRPVRCRWCVVTGMMLRCRGAGRIIRLGPRVTLTASCSVPTGAQWLALPGSGKTRRSALNRGTIGRGGRPRRVPWILPDRWREGRCRSVLLGCAADWKPNGTATARGRISRGSAGWRRIPFPSYGGPWNRPWQWGRSPAMPWPSSFLLGKTGVPRCAHWLALRICGTSAQPRPIWLPTWTGWEVSPE